MCYGCLYICICVIHDGCLYICICVMDVYIYVYVLYIMDCTWQPVYHSVRPITLSFTEPMVQRGLPLQFERRTQIINLVFIMFSSFFCCLMSEWYHSLIKQQKNDENIMNTKLIICVLRSNCNGNPLCTIGSVNERVIGLTE